MELLGLGQGATVGRALAALREEADCGLVTTPAQARAYLLAWWEREAGADGAEEVSRA